MREKKQNMAYIQLPIHVLGAVFVNYYCSVQFNHFVLSKFSFFLCNDEEDEDLTQQMEAMTRIGKTMIATYLLAPLSGALAVHMVCDPANPIQSIHPYNI